MFETGWKHAEERRLGTVICLECKGRLYSMGKAFCPPLRGAVHRWREVEQQYVRGVRWGSERW